MNINRTLALSICVTVSSITYAMNQEHDNDTYTIDIPLEAQNSINPQVDPLIGNNQQDLILHTPNNKETMLSLVNQLKSSFSKQRSKINKNTISSSIFFVGGMFSYAIGCKYENVGMTIVGLVQLTGSLVMGNISNNSQANQFQAENDLICENLTQNINTLPDIENQINNNNN